MLDYTKTAFIFPGQGSQVVGMAKDVATEYDVAHDIVQVADDIMGIKLSSLMFDGPEEELNQTKITQPAVYVASMAILRALQQELPDATPAFVAGHSLGEFTALTCADALPFEAGIALVRERARLMQEAGDQNPGGMAALLGISAEDAQRLADYGSQETGKPLVIANDNCPGQIVLSGDNAALEKAVDVAKDYGAKRVIPLAVSVATHSPLMQPAKDAFVTRVAETEFKTPTIPVIANVDAAHLTSVEAIRAELEAQLTSTVHWTQTLQAMIGAGVETFVEIGPGNVLTGLVRRTDKSKTRINIDNLESLRTFVAENS